MPNQVYSREELRSGIPVPSGQSVTITVKSLATVAVYDAHGGPATPRDDGYGSMKSPTEAGEYIIVGLWKHVSTGQWPYSMIEWGSPLRESNGIIEVMISGKWEPLKKYVPDSKDDLMNAYEDLFGKKEMPETWVFNDFGHITCFIAKDIDKDGVWDKGSEKIHHQFFHTTPPDEASTSRGKPFVLTESHGCIHVRPNDIDEMISHGYIRKGNMVYIHDYSTKPLGESGIETAKPPYSLHFFPEIKKLFIKGNK